MAQAPAPTWNTDYAPTRLCVQCQRPLGRKQGQYCSNACHGAAIERPLSERFWAKVDRGDGCWEWQGARRKPWNYGVVQTGRWGASCVQRAHRVAWALTYGPIPDGLWVLHRCDNPPCVRPDHLFLGDAFVNMQDCVQKGRHGSQVHPESRPRGSQHWRARQRQAGLE